jgi:broad specificity phosphatase PhoE
MRLILVRHGETDTNKARVALGRADVELNEHGRWQAQRVAASLKDESIGAIYSSPLKRALATAEPIAASHRLEMQIDGGLIEMDIGEMEALTFQQVSERHPRFLRAWLGGQAPYEAMPGGECLLDLQERAWEAIERIRERDEQGTVAAVTHNFVIIAVLCRVLGLDLANFRRLRHSLAAKSVLEMGRDQIIVVSFNDTCHLEAAQAEQEVAS